MSRTIQELVAICTAYANRQGFYPEGWTIFDKLKAIEEEAKEALEAYLQSAQPSYHSEGVVPLKVEGYGIELVDLIFRICSLVGNADLDLDQLIDQKLAYNATRPFRHGKKQDAQ